MGAIPQETEDIAFGVDELRAGCLARVYEKLEDGETELLVKKGYLVSSAFALLQREGKYENGRFVVYYSIGRKKSQRM